MASSAFDLDLHKKWWNGCSPLFAQVLSVIRPKVWESSAVHTYTLNAHLFVECVYRKFKTYCLFHVCASLNLAKGPAEVEAHESVEDGRPVRPNAKKQKGVKQLVLKEMFSI